MNRPPTVWIVRIGIDQTGIISGRRCWLHIRYTREIVVCVVVVTRIIERDIKSDHPRSTGEVRSLDRLPAEYSRPDQSCRLHHQDLRSC